jgi:hypothetical protein
MLKRLRRNDNGSNFRKYSFLCMMIVQKWRILCNFVPNFGALQKWGSVNDVFCVTLYKKNNGRKIFTELHHFVL